MSVAISFDIEIERLERNIYGLIGSYEMYGNVPNISCLSGLKRRRDDLLDKIMRQIQESGFAVLGNLVNELVKFYETYGTSFTIPCLAGLKRKKDSYINNIDRIIIGIVEDGQDQF